MSSATVTPGALLQCEPALKEFLIHLHQTERKFIIDDLDATHLFIDPAARDWLQHKIDELHNENTYTFIK